MQTNGIIERINWYFIAEMKECLNKYLTAK